MDKDGNAISPISDIQIDADNNIKITTGSYTRTYNSDGSLKEVTVLSNTYNVKDCTKEGDFLYYQTDKDEEIAINISTGESKIVYVNNEATENYALADENGNLKETGVKDKRPDITQITVAGQTIDMSNYSYENGVYTYSDETGDYRIEIDEKGNKTIYNPKTNNYTKYDSDGNPTKVKINEYERKVEVDESTGNMYATSLEARLNSLEVNENGVLVEKENLFISGSKYYVSEKTDGFCYLEDLNGNKYKCLLSENGTAYNLEEI